MKALIHNNVVIDTSAQEFEVAVGLEWVDAPDNVQQGWLYGGEGIFTNPIPAKTLEDVKADKFSALANFRYTKEIAGIVVSGAQIDTSRESQAVLTAARTLAKEKKAANEFYSVQWKGKNGWFTLNSDQIIAIADLVAAHVQWCFGREKYFAEIIDGLTSAQEIIDFNFELTWKP